MHTPETDPRITSGEAPFAKGDRVIYRPRPQGVEIVELVEYRTEGWGGWYIRARRREPGSTEVVTHHYDRAELFDPAPCVSERPIRRWLRLLRFGRRVRFSEIPPAERARAVAGWPPAAAPLGDRRCDRGGLAGLDRAHATERQP